MAPDFDTRLQSGRTHDRRTILKATGATLAGITLAGCLAGGQAGTNGDDSEADTTVSVGPDGGLSFEPEDITVTPGITVAWEWHSHNHNIVVEDQPDGADWSGTPGKASKIYNDGYRYVHTFDTLGEYEYVCQPHEAAGMVGTVTVSNDG
ncbi:plastocyanin/azurin family copper-binding protein [Haladaptatus sp. NG-SE-30]